MTEERQREVLECWYGIYCQTGEIEIVYGPTPFGGDYSILYYYDAKHRPCKKADASCIDIVEYKSDGTFVHSVLGFCGNNK